MASKTTYELEVRLGATTSASWNPTLKSAEKSLQGFNTLSNRIIAGAVAGVATATVTATRALSDALDKYTEFEQEMATVQSISGATGKEFELMKNAALDAGRTTVFTATESASALEYMSLAGWSVNDSIQGLTPILRLAAATQKDLKTTSDLVTDSMSALGIGVGGLDGYLDKLVESNNDANTSAEQLMEALVKSGGASRVLGVSLDDTITSLEVLANNGKKGSEAGRALNSIFVRLVGNAAAMKELENLNVKIWDDDGKFIGFENALIRINEAMSGLTDEQRSKSLKGVAGTIYYSQMQYLLDAVSKTEKDGKTAWDKLESQVEDSSGALDRMYGITTDTLSNAQIRLKDAYEDMQIRVVDVFSDDAKDFVGWLAERLPDATDSIVAFAEAHKGEFADALEGLGEGIETLWENGIAAGQWIMKNRGAVVGALTGIAVGIIAVKTAMLAMNIATAFTNPISAAIAVLGLAAEGIAILVGVMQDAEREAVTSNLADHFGKIALSLGDIEKAADYIVNSENLTGVFNALEEFDKLDGFSKRMEESTKTLEKLNWKVSIGMELTPQDQESYQAAIEDFIDAANEYAVQAQYSVSINMELAFEENEHEDVISKVNSFYSTKTTELSALGTELNEAMTNAFNDGLLEIDEINVIADIQRKMADIEKQLAVGDFEAELSLLKMEYSGKNLDADSFIKLQEKLDQKTAQAETAYKEAYAKNYSAITKTYNDPENRDRHIMSDTEYASAIADLETKLKSELAQVEMRAAQFEINTLTDNYSEEIAQYQNAVKDAIGIFSTEDYDYVWNESNDLLQTHYDVWDNIKEQVLRNGPDDTTKKAIEELLNNASGVISQIYETAENDWYVLSPEAQSQLQETITNIETLQGLTARRNVIGYGGDTDALSRSIATEVENAGPEGNEAMYGWVDKYFHDLAGHAEIAASETVTQITTNAENQTIKPAVEDAYNYTQQTIDSTFAQGFKTTAGIYLSLYTTGDKTLAATDPRFKPQDVKHNAKGGIWNTPILTTFAEEGPEAAVPLDGSARAKSIWARAGEMLGMFPKKNRDGEALAKLEGSGTGGSISVSFNPVITIQGSASREDVSQAMSLSLEELRTMLAEIQREDNRVSFA